MKDYEVLEAAAEYIEQHGWIQETLTDGEAVCIVGSMYGVCGYLSEINEHLKIEMVKEPFDLLASYMKSQEIASWNDAPERTEQEVLDALQKAAKLGRIREDCAELEGTL